MAGPKFSEIQLDAINGGVDIRHLPDGTSEIGDCAGYLLPNQAPGGVERMPTTEVDEFLLEAMRKNPAHWSIG